MLSDDSAIRALNRDWRGKNAPTNVLSFPAAAPGKARSASPYIGDIVIAYRDRPRARRSPRASRSTTISRISPSMDFCICSATTTTTTATPSKMERLERKILARLAVPDPYARVTP